MKCYFNSSTRFEKQVLNKSQNLAEELKMHLILTHSNFLVNPDSNFLNPDRLHIIDLHVLTNEAQTIAANGKAKRQKI